MTFQRKGLALKLNPASALVCAAALIGLPGVAAAAGYTLKASYRVGARAAGIT